MNRKSLQHTVQAMAFAWLAATGVAPADPVDSTSQTVPPAYQACEVCHGVRLGGNYGVRAPRISGLPAWYVENQLEGFKHNLRGQLAADSAGLEMQPIAAQLNPGEVSEAAAFVSRLSSPLPPDVFRIQGSAQSGERLYASCAVCHGDQGQGNPAVEAPPLTIQDGWYLATQLRHFREGIRGAVPGDLRGAQMRAATGVLSEDQNIDDITAYIEQLRGFRESPESDRPQPDISTTQYQP